MMDEAQPQSVALQLAESGKDLVTAIEAAQYARLIDRSESEAATEAAASDLFVELFATAAESWEDLAAVQRTALLGRLGDQLDRLEACGLFVHWGRIALAVVRSEHEPLQLPAAVLSISRAGAPTIEVVIPGGLALDSGAGTIH